MFRSLLQTRGFIVLILLVFLSTGVAAQDVFVKSQAVDRAVIAEMEKLQVVGVAIGIIRNSKVVYTKGYGLANLRTRTPVTSDTIFNWASNSKPLIAIAAMQLVQDAQLDLDKTIGTYVPSLPDHLKRITTRQLLCHQSGIPHYTRSYPLGKKSQSTRRTRSIEQLTSLRDVSVDICARIENRVLVIRLRLTNRRCSGSR